MPSQVGLMQHYYKAACLENPMDRGTLRAAVHGVARIGHDRMTLTLALTSGGDRIPVELFQILKDDVVKVLHSTCLQIWRTQQWPQDWKRSAFIPIPKKGNVKECLNYCTIGLTSHASKAMLKIQVRLQ